MVTNQSQLDDLCREASQFLELQFGPAVECLSISATFCEFEVTPWAINIQVPCGDVHGFPGSDAENAVHNLERFGVEVIRRGLVHQPTNVQSA